MFVVGGAKAELVMGMAGVGGGSLCLRCSKANTICSSSHCIGTK